MGRWGGRTEKDSQVHLKLQQCGCSREKSRKSCRTLFSSAVLFAHYYYNVSHARILLCRPNPMYILLPTFVRVMKLTHRRNQFWYRTGTHIRPTGSCLQKEKAVDQKWNT